MKATDLPPDLQRKLFGKVLVRKKPKGLAAELGEEMFDQHCRARGLPVAVKEHIFAQEALGRMWRFDRCWPHYRLAVEVEGLVACVVNGVMYAHGRHATFTGFEGDCAKYSAAARLGWFVLRFSTSQVRNHFAIDETEAFLRSRGWVG